MQEKATSEPTLDKALGELEHARHDLGEAVSAERRAEEEIDKAEHIIEELERESHIKVNGRTREIEGNVASFEQVVKFAFPSGPTKPNTKFTVTYRNAAQVPAMGELDPLQTVKVKPGHNPENETIFNVTETVLS
ncbi:MAG: multiubiquitin domain-containing protein [Devosia sp.]|nr:multiubiquitin domain-containing protein [Devosia sp.]